MQVIAIFDIGKTNKKLFLFDEKYQLVYEDSTQLQEITDEEGFPCEDVQALTDWIRSAYQQVLSKPGFDIKAINVSGYGASLVHIDENGNPVTPLYNYLKPFPKTLHDQLYNNYGGEIQLSKETASPVLGSLNSGLQLYRIKYEQPEAFKRIKYTLHLPQYISFVLSQRAATDITSVGCHTLLWDFSTNDYHQWAKDEGLPEKFAPFYPGDASYPTLIHDKNLPMGVGLHDSSAALIPYLASFNEPFVLISSGTWCISLNPFNQTLLTAAELQQDCLCYLTYQGKAVKSSRLFAGNEHEQQIKRLASHFKQPVDYFKTVGLNPELLIDRPLKQTAGETKATALVSESIFQQRNLADFNSYEEAYHQLIADLITQQITSTQLVLNGAPVKKLFVDGGFSKNPIYMHLLAHAFPEIEVYAASMAQATAMGAALAIHSSWNSQPIPGDIIELKRYSPSSKISSTDSVLK
ncbi:carbohydrate kinase [Rhodocytophaga rosea]|uniref:Carbohydrate kinase n=1 Tax=Rhodocytophaga rosea TaxID=2704465 RepID=A0A6C0GBY3_9BACT|nr:FGGY family carbohydrate kinase [Rhodocytophaga rosea]QHT65455.1 carbohydrate kinase [Rhodocytophaga rosea]